MGLGNQDYTTVRLWSTPAEIFKSGVGGQVLPIQGRNFLIRSDFPVRVFFDGKQVGNVGGSFTQFQRIKLRDQDSSPRFLTLRFPAGEGENAAGTALVAADIQGRHGNFCIDCAWDTNVDLLPPDPDLLPVTAFVITGSVAAGISGPWTTQTIAQTVFRTPFNQTLPQEIWIKNVAWQCTGINGQELWAGITPYNFSFQKTDVPAGDAETWLELPCGYSGNQRTVSLGNYKVPIRSLYAQYAAEAPANMVVPTGSSRFVPADWQLSLIASYLI